MSNFAVITELYFMGKIHEAETTDQDKPMSKKVIERIAIMMPISQRNDAAIHKQQTCYR